MTHIINESSGSGNSDEEERSLIKLGESGLTGAIIQALQARSEIISKNLCGHSRSEDAEFEAEVIVECFLMFCSQLDRTKSLSVIHKLAQDMRKTLIIPEFAYDGSPYLAVVEEQHFPGCITVFCKDGDTFIAALISHPRDVKAESLVESFEKSGSKIDFLLGLNSNSGQGYSVKDLTVE